MNQITFASSSRRSSWHSTKQYDYPHLRAWHRARQQQQRSFFNAIPNFVQNYQLKQLELKANSQPNNVALQREFVQALVQQHPQAALQRLSQSPFVLDETMLLQYLQLLQSSGNKVSEKQLHNVLARVQSPHVAQWQQQWHELASKGGASKDSVAQLYRLLTTGSATSSTTPGIPSIPTSTAFYRGMDKQAPLYVQLAHTAESGRSVLLQFVLRATLLVIGVSAVGALLEERTSRPGGGGGLSGIMGTGNSKHIQEATESHVTFDQVKGVSEAKQELEEIVQYLKDPSKFTRLGGKLPRGVLLTGPPGTGKTLLAKAIAGEAGVPFFYSSGSQFEEVYVGLGAKRIRELFEVAKKKAPAIIFIDEIDAVGGTRKLKDQSALKMTLNELLVQLDGFDENNGIIVIGATNFAESLDDALLRPGRFDKHVVVPLPDVGGRQEILELYAQKTKLGPDVDLSVLARGTTGMSGADLFNLMNQAALKASLDGLPYITMTVLEYAKDKILMGAERKSAVITPETAKCTAYHEAGHALVAVLTNGALPIHKATIMPRGSALGMVTMLPEGDQTSQSYKEMLAYMDVSMGGRVAEELIFGKENVTSGASSDIQQATRIARNMVTKFGFSDQVGIVFHGGNSGEESASSETRARIDAEVQRLTHEAYVRAKDLLMRHSKEHALLAETLLEYETLTGDEVRDLVRNGRKPQRPALLKQSSTSGGGSKTNEGGGSGTGIRGRLFGSSSSRTS
ncbi:ATP-dependent metalloprotease [Fistulifera solaris]|jgi:ATP-dependent metalloprotease|uniref:ATP-dependent metalloprotease n=1 Tax=Fistulifera solaris TaxID=1519565 RepID=A0A1Z5K928_FISSO|nr:ATP-dependent metalloprotease [Fistulifera solaris]|eukprot:GAX22769.1 ATP-dependent metalloprotease [Fistulifera solaris]